MTKQNRTLGFLVVFSAVVLLGLLWVSGVFERDTQANSQATGEKLPIHEGPESAGDPIDTRSSASVREAQLAFGQVMQDISDCFEMKSVEPGKEFAVNVEAFLDEVQPSWGPATKQGDRWMSWHLKTKEGREKRYRLEIIETEEGAMKRQLQLFHVDRDGIPVGVELPDNESENPTDEALNQILKDGDVFYKEQAGYLEFSEGERVEYLMADNTLVELEVVRGETIFKCSSLKARESCTCTK